MDEARDGEEKKLIKSDLSDDENKHISCFHRGALSYLSGCTNRLLHTKSD